VLPDDHLSSALVYARAGKMSRARRKSSQEVAKRSGPKLPRQCLVGPLLSQSERKDWWRAPATGATIAMGRCRLRPLACPLGSDSMEIPLRVLVLEDSDADAALLVRTLRRQGYDVAFRRVETPAEVRAALADGVWDAAVSDYSMPCLTVPESLAIFRDMNVDIPFIVVSGTVGEEMAVLAMKAGAHDFFLKDRMARLGSAIERELREAKVRRERRVAMQRLTAREQELEEAVRIRDEFIAIASHELRTPLTPLLLELGSAIDLLRSGRLQSEVALDRLGSKLGNCLGHLERLTALITNMLDVGQIKGGRLHGDQTQVDLREVVRTLLQRLRPLVTKSKSEIRLRADEPVVGLWDLDGIEAIVINLLTNALKFGEGRPIDIVVERRDDVARLSVTDQGIGILPEEQVRIFERFERAVPSQHYGGFGIGLWLARQVTEAHGGSLRVSSAKGLGSTFVLELPTPHPLPRLDIAISDAARPSPPPPGVAS